MACNPIRGFGDTDCTILNPTNRKEMISHQWDIGEKRKIRGFGPASNEYPISARQLLSFNSCTTFITAYNSSIKNRIGGNVAAQFACNSFDYLIIISENSLKSFRAIYSVALLMRFGTTSRPPSEPRDRLNRSFHSNS
jgi:hypothetical protein